jgi:hypothetical protein
MSTSGKQIKAPDMAANAATQSGRATPTTSGPTTVSTSYADVPEMTVTLVTEGGSVIVVAQISFNHSAGSVAVNFALSQDGAAEVFDVNLTTVAAGFAQQAVVVGHFTPAAGSHTWKMRWKTGSGTLAGLVLQRSMFALEGKRS